MNDKVESTQEVEFNVDKIYDDFIKEIDDIRSLTPISSVAGLNFSKLKISNFGSNQTDLNVSNTATESRCHAFYRLIGFPVISSSYDFYSPGFFKDLNASSDEIEKRLNLLKQIDSKFYQVSTFRESYYSQIIAPIFSRKDITASVIALSSYNIREFASSVKNNIKLEGFDLIKPQSYSENFYKDPFDQDPNGETLKEYSFGTDSDGIAVTANTKDINTLSTRYHLIQPYLVDPRIDLTTQPSDRKICVPFLENKSKTQLKDNVYLKRPLIEKVIRDRFYQQENQKSAFSASSPLESSIEYFKSFDSIQDNDLLEKIYSGNIYSLNEQGQFIRFLATIRSIHQRLFEALNVIKETRDRYHWIPRVSEKGPEFGSTTNEINVLDTDRLNTPLDENITVSFSKYMLAQTISRLPLDTLSDALGFFAFSNFDAPVNPDNKESVESIAKKSLDEAVANRNSDCEKANKALATVEMIMGEFSGLGLVDIMVIYYALYLVDKSALIGLVDDKVIDRMNTMNYKELGARMSIIESYDSFSNVVKNLYDIVDSLWKDIKLNTG